MGGGGGGGGQERSELPALPTNFAPSSRSSLAAPTSVLFLLQHNFIM